MHFQAFSNSLKTFDTTLAAEVQNNKGFTTILPEDITDSEARSGIAWGEVARWMEVVSRGVGIYTGILFLLAIVAVIVLTFLKWRNVKSTTVPLEVLAKPKSQLKKSKHHFHTDKYFKLIEGGDGEAQSLDEIC